MPMKNAEFKTYFFRLTETLSKLDVQAIEHLIGMLLDAREHEHTIFIL